jgi:acyl-CoA synthetase (AMP-forming)/AMP-acid ligase II
LAKEKEPALEFEQLPFDHPLYIMFSSGTTGKPKCLVQSAGGILINHLKELMLQSDLGRDDVHFFITTCSWMMWNWLVCSLSVGATIVLFDGSPFFPDPGVLCRLVEDEKITIFGTSARYLVEIERCGLHPAQQYNLNHLLTVLSTGSPLPPESFGYVYRDIKNDVLLSSISGGTAAPPTESVVAALQDTEWDTKYDLGLLIEIRKYFLEVWDKYRHLHRFNALKVDPSVTLHQIPGQYFLGFPRELENLQFKIIIFIILSHPPFPKSAIRILRKS